MHSTYPSSLFVRNLFVSSFCHHPKIPHRLASSLLRGFFTLQCSILQCCSVRVPSSVPARSLCHGYPENLGTRRCKRGRVMTFVWMCKQNGMGLPCAKSSFAYICWNWWNEGVMTWSGERPHCSPGVDMASNSPNLPWSCAPSSQALSVEGVW